MAGEHPAIPDTEREYRVRWGGYYGRARFQSSTDRLSIRRMMFFVPTGQEGPGTPVLTTELSFFDPPPSYMVVAGIDRHWHGAGDGEQEVWR